MRILLYLYVGVVGGDVKHARSETARHLKVGLQGTHATATLHQTSDSIPVSPQAAGASHGVGLARSRLSIGQNSGVKPLEKRCQPSAQTRQKDSRSGALNTEEKKQRKSCPHRRKDITILLHFTNRYRADTPLEAQILGE